MIEKENRLYFKKLTILGRPLETARKGRKFRMMCKNFRRNILFVNQLLNFLYMA